MNKSYISLGLMTGTSADGIDASLVVSDGRNKFKVLHDEYKKYPAEIYDEFHKLKEKILNFKDIKKYSKRLKSLEEKITLWSSIVVETTQYKLHRWNLDKKLFLVGFHGQTILHSPERKFSLQLGNAKLLSQMSNTTVIFKFRDNDLKNDGQGAPLAPIFHKLLVKEKKIKLPITILNLGGIANITSIDKNNKILSSDIGPGNCLIDTWMRFNSNLYYDENGKIARSGKINKNKLNQLLENFYENKISKKKSFDTKDFDLSFIRGMSLKDGAATLTEFTAEVCSKKIANDNIYVCGGGRKNKFLIERIRKKINNKIELIDKLGIDGDFVEAQAFAYLAIRSYLKLPISFPETTGCKKPCTGGVIIKNF